MQCSPNQVCSQCRLLTQSVKYCAVPTLIRCDSDPIKKTVPVASVLPPTASASAWTISWRLPSSTLTILRHFLPSVSGRHAGKAWSMPASAIGPPLAAFSRCRCRTYYSVGRKRSMCIPYPSDCAPCDSAVSSRCCLQMRMPCRVPWLPGQG